MVLHIEQLKNCRTYNILYLNFVLVVIDDRNFTLKILKLLIVYTKTSRAQVEVQLDHNLSKGLQGHQCRPAPDYHIKE